MNSFYITLLYLKGFIFNYFMNIMILVSVLVFAFYWLKTQADLFLSVLHLFHHFIYILFDR